MKVVNTANNEILLLNNEPFARGGEGALYRISSPASYQHLVAKIYHPSKRTEQRSYKLRYLISHPPEFESEQQSSLVSWPLALIEHELQFVGFLMPMAEGLSLEILATSRLPKQLGTSWDRFSLENEGAFSLRRKLCFNIAVALYHIHRTGRYVMVDFKPDNILIQQNGLVSLVDMDSIEVVEGNRMLFAAAVATPEFAPPEFHDMQRSAAAIPLSWDTFSMAVIFYKILLGIHPFAATAKGEFSGIDTLGEKIKNGLFVHNSKFKNSFEVIPLPHLEFNSLPSSLQYLFNLCFIQGMPQAPIRPTAEDWCQALDVDSQSLNLSFYDIPDNICPLKIDSLPEERARIFDFSFSLTYGTLIENNLPQVIKFLKKEKKRRFRTPFKIAALLSFLSALCLVISEYYYFSKIFYSFYIFAVVPLFFIFHLIAVFFIHRNLARPLPSILDPDIPKELKSVFKIIINQLYDQHQFNKLEFRNIVNQYQDKLSFHINEWNNKLQEYQQKSEVLYANKREACYNGIKNRNDHPLWKQFVGNSLNHKLLYIKKKYLPFRLQELKDDYDLKIKNTDLIYQDAWQELETKHYKHLSRIEKINKKSIEQIKSDVEEQLTQKIVDAGTQKLKELLIESDSQINLLQDQLFNDLESQHQKHQKKMSEFSDQLEKYFSHSENSELDVAGLDKIRKEMKFAAQLFDKEVEILRNVFNSQKEDLIQELKFKEIIQNDRIDTETKEFLNNFNQRFLKKQLQLELSSLQSSKIRDKQEEEIDFIQKRQQIINNIKNDKKEALNNYNRLTKLNQDNVNDYIEELKSLDSETSANINAVEERSNLSFEKMMQEAYNLQEQQYKAVKDLQIDFLDDFNELTANAGTELKKIGINTKLSIL